MRRYGYRYRSMNRESGIGRRSIARRGFAYRSEEKELTSLLERIEDMAINSRDRLTSLDFLLTDGVISPNSPAYAEAYGARETLRSLYATIKKQTSAIEKAIEKAYDKIRTAYDEFMDIRDEIDAMVE